MLKQKRKIISLLVMTIIVNILFNSIIAVGFDPSGGDGDDETNKEYTAKLLDLQFNTIMPLSPLSLDDEFSSDSMPMLLGAVQINHVTEQGTEILETDPKIELVNTNGTIVATTEVYSVGTDTYYIDIYDLNVNNDEQYKLLASFTDNYGNEIEKYVTYDGSLFISEYTEGTMSYKALNNIAVISFNLGNKTTLKGDMNKNGIVESDDAVIVSQIISKKIELTDEHLQIGDMDNDGKLTTIDAIKILQIVNGDFVKGDLNNDGLVNSADAAKALSLYKYNNATEMELLKGDMNDDGIINSSDAAKILTVYKYNY
ncbi:MAG: dockerin type I repeat-containing protein [Clostridia bacterium]|nr:dockerin type I repeat-containing protein [Clostridia bacterium]